MIKVLNIISDTNIGGAGRCLLNFLKYYDRTKYQVQVALPERSALRAEVSALDTRVFEVTGMADRSFSLSAVRALRALIRAEAPDIVHTHGAMSGRVAAKGTGAKIVYTRHSAFPVPERIQKNPGRFVNKTVNEFFADRVIAVSPACAQNLTDGGIDAQRITVMMNGVEPVAPAPPAAVEALRAQYGLTPTDFVTGILARIEDYKGHLTIVDAMAQLRDAGRNVKCIIAGEGSFEPVVRARVAELDLADSVIFAGFVRDVAPILSLLDLQLNASYGTEASSLAMIEAFSLGVPVVASDYGGNPWMVDEGEDGFLFPARNSAALAERITQLMDAPDTLASMKRRAREIYTERFTGEIFARNVEAVYDLVLEG